ncbi:MAG: cytochrome c-type biogenesis protein CcmH [Pseudobacteriovorax sp.]|nr:cytochrome c-type biogenesis protein CcmH [Pseudobacteriovorax sp.]
MKWLISFCLLSLTFHAFSQGDKKQPSDKEQLEFRDVAGELRCPTCTGLSVLESDAGFSVQIKDQVKVLMDDGKEKEEILDFFVDRYGPWILREPPKSGFNLVAWAFPFAVLIIGPIVVWFAVWRKKVVVDTGGLRSDDAIVEEMRRRLSDMKRGDA